MKNLSDSQLLAYVNQDHVLAFEVLFDRHWDKLYRIALSRVQDTDDAQDILQEVFISIWNRRNSIVIKTSFEGYLTGALKFAVISHLRSQKAKQHQLEEAMQRINILETTVDDLSNYYLLEKTLEEAVNAMPQMLKQVYLLRSDNLSVKEIADKLGLADQTVKNYITEVLRRLKIVISRKYPEEYLGIIAAIYALIN
ncbi:RNA polymerase sigma factor [Pedobacter foliorum]|uniref:RNA polymerase sigma factor n=1 Tax=Pedobacter foliorum TaxID=2739058 RepID=UPI0015676B42|nr:sigma-70 family RNA polymerase sigma factor [Pedobacter foliorum]NRF39531.1 sigma-70 family RNA polymerase sigma factor [Pedobacter foliorum]